MKKLTFALTVLSVLIFASCNSNSGKKQDTAQTTTEAVSTDSLVTATLTNPDGIKLELAFNNAAETATVVFNGETIELKQQPMASGIRYTNANYELTQWQGETELKKDGKTVFSHKESKNEVIVNELVSKDGKTLKVEYAEKDGKMVAIVTYDNQPAQTLAQTEAWAKGAEYKNEKMKWEAQGDNGKLTVDGKTISFSPKK